ncbi:MAG: SPOR domain-containing protein [Bacteroidaceae bacterium]|nr:SPOR domain-containing protein [Bacteroidaceae bacterium]
MKNYIVLGAAVCLAFAMTSCKSSESAYKKAYERARAQQAQQEETVVAQTQQTQEFVQQPQQVTPVQTVTTAPVVANENARAENVTLVSGAGLRAYSVVVGSFSVKTNAEGLQRTLNNSGYQAQIAMNPNGMYRVIASTFDDMGSAVQSRNVLRQQYPDAWLLRK